MMARSWLTSVGVLGVWLAVVPSPARAQFGGGFGNGGGFGGNNNGLGSAAGIVIDAEGVVQMRSEKPLPAAALKKQVSRFAQDKLPANVLVEASERIVSLKNVEALLREARDQKSNLPLEVSCLAGLFRIDSVVFDAEAQDVYLAGPAEAFGPDNLGRMVGATSGRPVLLLEDLITALRATRGRERSIGCSIDPTPENMRALQQFLQQNSTPASSGEVQQRFRMMANVLGPQEISIWGVPKDSHFAVALVEADIRMKRIALGLDPAGIPGIRSHLSLLKPQGNSLQRWWFVPMYDPLETNRERTIFLLKGQRAKLLSQDEISDASGHRTDASYSRQSTEKFAQLFTEKFQELADHSVPFAELQNLYDLAVVATLVNVEGKRHLGPDALALFYAEEELPLPKYIAPQTIPSASTFRSAGPGTILGLVGGVTMDLEPVFRGPQVRETEPVQTFRSVMKNQSLFGDATAP